MQLQLSVMTAHHHFGGKGFTGEHSGVITALSGFADGDQPAVFTLSRTADEILFQFDDQPFRQFELHQDGLGRGAQHTQTLE